MVGPVRGEFRSEFSFFTLLVLKSEILTPGVKKKSEMSEKSKLYSKIQYGHFAQYMLEQGEETTRRRTNLRNYCAVMATVMPTTTQVESDFSRIGHIRDNRTTLSVFNVQCDMHAKQWAILGWVLNI